MEKRSIHVIQFHGLWFYVCLKYRTFPKLSTRLWGTWEYVAVTSPNVGFWISHLFKFYRLRGGLKAKS
jgi:hypothetical protein